MAAVALASGTTRLRRFAGIEAALTWAEDRPAPLVLTVDMPIGLPARHGLRACDREARGRLGRRWMTVFAPPDRELFGLDFASARDLVRARRAADLDAAPAAHPIATHETINIMPKVAEVDRAVRAVPGRAARLLECHPELCFLAMAGRDLASKRSPEGHAQRRGLIAAAFPDAPARIDAAGWRRSEVGRDDLLDAYAALWSALRVTRGEQLELGDGARDAAGLPQRIVV